MPNFCTEGLIWGGGITVSDPLELQNTLSKCLLI